MSNLTKDELAALEGAEGTVEYGTIVRDIKKARGGQYPEDWWPLVMASGGISERLAKKWKKPDAFEIKLVHPQGKD